MAESSYTAALDRKDNHHVAIVSIDVVVPLRNEGAFVGRLLSQLAGQTLPYAHLILVVAPSEDDTLSICMTAAKSDDRIIVLENPDLTAPYAMNRALERVTSDAWIRIDGHTEIPNDLLEVLRDEMSSTGAACVAPVLRSGYHSRMQEAIGIAMASPLGVGTARFRTGVGGSGYVDAAAFGLYSTAVTRQVGQFNEAMVRNQDDEYNTRLRRAGGQIWLTTRVAVTYFPRGTYSSLWRQYSDYGLWRAIGTTRFGNQLRLRQVAPSALVLALAGGLVTSLVGKRVWPATAATSAYMSVLAAQFVRTKRSGFGTALAGGSVGAVAVMHLAYGLGFIRGLVQEGLSERE